MVNTAMAITIPVSVTKGPWSDCCWMKVSGTDVMVIAGFMLIDFLLWLR